MVLLSGSAIATQRKTFNFHIHSHLLPNVAYVNRVALKMSLTQTATVLQESCERIPVTATASLG